MDRFITRPVSRLNASAKRVAELDLPDLERGAVKLNATRCSIPAAE